MWQSSNNRSWAKKAKKKPRHQKQPLKFLRVDAEIKISAGLGAPPVLLEARLILNEFNPKGLHLFCSERIEPGQEVSITIENPRRIYVRGKIINCQNVETDKRLITEEVYPYRLGIAFNFGSEEEQKEVESFCTELQQKFLFGMLALSSAA